MRQRVLVSILAILLLLTPGVLHARIGTIDDVPAATLLLPYFEVDLDEGVRTRTVVRIGNAMWTPTVVHATLWTDAGVPTFAFDIYLGGYDVQEVYVDLLFQGILPHTGPDLSNSGPFSSPHVPLGCAGLLPASRLSVEDVTFLQQAHTGVMVERWSRCAGMDHGDNFARGYITFDVAVTCSSADTFPNSAEYFINVASTENRIWGDVEVLDIWNNFAQGETLVHIEADPDHPATDGVPDGTTPDYTFYSRQLWPALGIDHREGLATRWSVPYILQAILETEVTVWRDPGQVDPWTCGAAFPLIDFREGVIFDEEENSLFPPLGCGPFRPAVMPFASQRVAVGGPELPVPFWSGWIYLDLGIPTWQDTLFGGLNQSWVSVAMNSSGRFSGGFAAWPLDNVAAAEPRDIPPCPACSDGADNDGDGGMDFIFPDSDYDGYQDVPDGWPPWPHAPQPDQGCKGPASDNESPQCNDGIDNDGDNLVDMDDPECFAPWHDDESDRPPECENEIDDDGDGLVDFWQDPDCDDGWPDDDESS